METFATWKLSTEVIDSCWSLGDALIMASGTALALVLVFGCPFTHAKYQSIIEQDKANMVRLICVNPNF